MRKLKNVLIVESHEKYELYVRAIKLHMCGDRTEVSVKTTVRRQ